MPRAAKSKSRKKRRNVSISNATFTDHDISSHLSQIKHRRNHIKAIKTRVHATEAQRDVAINLADQPTSLYLTNVPSDISAQDIVLAVGSLLCSVGAYSLTEWRIAVEQGVSLTSGPVLRCQIRVARRSSAHIVLRNHILADRLIHSSPFLVKGCNVQAKLDNRPFVFSSSLGWRSQPDINSSQWTLHGLQLGEQDCETSFFTLWTLPCSMGNPAKFWINHIQRVLIVESVHPILLKRSASDTTFSLEKANIRFEFPTGSIWDCQVQTEQDPSHTALYFRIAHPPLIFRASKGSVLAVRDRFFWDCISSDVPQTKWTRTVDPSQSESIGRSSGLRLVVATSELTALCKALYHACILRDAEPVVMDSILDSEIIVARAHHIFSRAARHHRVPFSVRYMVACIVSMGNLSLRALTSSFWTVLSDGVTEEQALAALDIMYFILSNPTTIMSDDQRGLVDAIREDHEQSASTDQPRALLIKCLQTCNVRTVHTVGDLSSPSGNVNHPYSSDEDEHDVDELLEDLMPTNDDTMSQTASEIASTITGGHGLIRQFDPAQKSNEALVRRVVVTPTRIISQKPEIDMMNRVLREFSKHKERFLRVSFCDEDGGSIAFAASEDLYARLRVVLRDGLEIAGDTFVFLAFSNSQLREHALWMYNEKRGIDGGEVPSADNIREWMGDFSHILVPGKFAARQGQAFSATVRSIAVDKSQILNVCDTECQSKKYIFSDGVGIIASDMAATVAKAVHVRPHGHVPSAFQIRLGGAKGMLTVIDSSILARSVGSRAKVLLRESMRKFESTHTTLEIVGIAKRIPFYLNRQIISLLSEHGVPDDIFLLLQNNFIQDLDQSFSLNGLHAALRILYTCGGFDAGHKMAGRSASLNAMTFFQNGLNCVNCEHLFNVMNAFRNRLLKDLKNRARIAIDPDRAVCAIGVMDEFGVLEEREIFCQFKHPVSGEKKIITGLVVVGRSPCLHPGDIQLVTAVDKPSLHGLVDVVVFPSRGPRPIPSMLGGGDLDGDIFFCITDHRLLPPDIGRVDPMQYEAPAPNKLDRPVKWQDVASFFVNYIKNDRLGQIANAHVVAADREPAGIFSEKCLMLAELHSCAVDFAKSGVPATVPRELLPSQTTDSYPDFLGKHRKVSYPSTKVLGKLYRACDSHVRNDENGLRSSSFKPSIHSQRVHNIVNSFPISDSMMSEALAACKLYNLELYRLMDQYAVETEGEAVAGQVLEFGNLRLQMRGKQDHFSTQIMMNRQMQSIRDHFRRQFFSELGIHGAELLTAEVILKALSWYKACEEIAAADRRENGDYLLSFPWIVSDILLKVIGHELDGQKTAKTEREPENLVSLISQLSTHTMYER